MGSDIFMLSLRNFFSRHHFKLLSPNVERELVPNVCIRIPIGTSQRNALNVASSLADPRKQPRLQVQNVPQSSLMPHCKYIHATLVPMTTVAWL